MDVELQCEERQVLMEEVHPAVIDDKNGEEKKRNNKEEEEYNNLNYLY